MKYLLIFLMMCASVFGVPQTCTFDAATDANWSTVTNWNGSATSDIIPVAGDTVVIAEDCTLDVVTPPSLAALTVNTTKTLTNGTATSLTVVGAITLAGTLTDTTLVTVSAATITNSGAGGMSVDATTTTITANLICAGTDDLITVAGSGTLTVTGNLTNTEVAGSGDWCLQLTNDATIIINGNITGGTGGGGASGVGGIYALGASAITVNGTINGGTGVYTNAGIWFAVTGGTLNCTTLAYAADSAVPVLGLLPTMDITTITIDGTAIGGGGGYRSRYNFN